LSHPTRTKPAAAATGVIAGARGGIQALIWRLGSTGREGINLSGNNQPDFVEPYFGPVAAGGSFGGTLWFDRYQHIRSINVYLAALGNAKDAAVDPVQGLSTQEKAGARAVANSLKALALLYVVETRGELGAPVDVDRPLNAAPAPFVSEDSAYGYIVGLLNGAATDLTTAGDTAFPVPVHPRIGRLDKTATFLALHPARAARQHPDRGRAQVRDVLQRRPSGPRSRDPDHQERGADSAPLRGKLVRGQQGAGDPRPEPGPHQLREAARDDGDGSERRLGV